MNETDKPPSQTKDSKGDCSQPCGSRIGISDLYWVPVWKSTNLAGLGIHSNISRNCLPVNSLVDLVSFGDS